MMLTKFEIDEELIEKTEKKAEKVSIKVSLEPPAHNILSVERSSIIYEPPIYEYNRINPFSIDF